MILDVIKNRRSVRSFIDRPVERRLLAACLEAARLAPSACNAQPWKFIVVDDPKVKEKLNEAAFGGIYSMNSFCKSAGAMVAVVSERQKFIAKVGGLLRGTQFYLIDIGIACEHFVLQAQALGLGTCWIGWFNEKGVKEVLGIPKDKKVDVLIPVGYYDTSKPAQDKVRYPPEETSSFNKY